jgi:hypothetical protein
MSGMWLRFHDYGVKAYARTPGGEYAWSNRSGLYEWRDGVRIHYTGGDQQWSDRNGMWTDGPAGDRGDRPWPHQLGFAAALSKVRVN